MMMYFSFHNYTPTDVTVQSRGTAMFTFVVIAEKLSLGSVTTDDVKWDYNMGNAITSYMYNHRSSYGG